jgi:hypothetical protein
LPSNRRPRTSNTYALEITNPVQRIKNPSRFLYLAPPSVAFRAGPRYHLRIRKRPARASCDEPAATPGPGSLLVSDRRSTLFKARDLTHLRPRTRLTRRGERRRCEHTAKKRPVTRHRERENRGGCLSPSNCRRCEPRAFNSKLNAAQARRRPVQYARATTSREHRFVRKSNGFTTDFPWPRLSVVVSQGCCQQLLAEEQLIHGDVCCCHEEPVSTRACVWSIGQRRNSICWRPGRTFQYRRR